MPAPRVCVRIRPLVALAVLLASASCDLTETYPLGKLSVRVMDENSVGIQGALLDLYKLENGVAIHWRATASSSAGTAVFGASDGGVIEGDYFVRVRFTTPHQLAAGEANDRPVTVREGEDITVTFLAVANAAGV